MKPGPFGGFLGGAYDPVWSEFRAQGTREVLRDAGTPDVTPRTVADPYLGILPTDRFEVVASDETVTLDRLNRRASLLDQFDAARRHLDRSAATTAIDRHRALARSALTSSKVRDALDVQREPARRRERYGMAMFDQSCLPARRLLEAGGMLDDTAIVVLSEHGRTPLVWCRRCRAAGATTG